MINVIIVSALDFHISKSSAVHEKRDRYKSYADMAELADALDLGSSVNRRAGSTPVIRTFRDLRLFGGFRSFFSINLTIDDIKIQLFDIDNTAKL